jgi:hypothetical protein
MCIYSDTHYSAKIQNITDTIAFLSHNYTISCNRSISNLEEWVICRCWVVIYVALFDSSS